MMKKLFLLLFTLLFVTCSERSQEETTRLKFRIDNSKLSENRAGWAIGAAYSGLGDIDCIGILVDYPEDPNGFCTVNTGSGFGFNVSGGTIPVASPGVYDLEMLVKSGAQRTIRLLGFKDDDGSNIACSNIKEINQENFRRPQVVFEGIFDLAPGEFDLNAVVSVGSISSSQIIDCVGGDLDTGGDGNFNPYDYGTPAVWLDASDLSSLYITNDCTTTPVTADAQSVGCWKDKSGNGYDYTEATNAPTYGENSFGTGLHGVTFDGVNDKLSNGSINGNYFSGVSGLTVFIVNRYDTLAGAQAVWGGGDSGTSRFVIYKDIASNFFTTLSGASSVIATSAASASTNYLHAASSDFSTGTQYINGSVDGIGAAGTPGTTWAYYLGSWNNGGGPTNPFGGSVAELLVYDGVLSAGDVALISAHLTSKWSVP